MGRSLPLHDAQKEAMAKGVEFRTIYEAEFDNLDFFCRSMENFQKEGEAIRISLNLPIKLHLFDKTAAMLSMRNHADPKENLTYVVIEHSDLSEMLFTTFDTYWQQSKNDFHFF